MVLQINALFAPAEVDALHAQDLSQTACVVFDVLRATSTLLTALGNGAAAVIPVADIPEALELRRRDPRVLLGGERDGRRIEARLSGGTDFDLGNSPRECTSDRVADRILVCTTTNGTKALHGCRHAAVVLPGSLLNLQATARALQSLALPKLLLIGAGTHDEAAYEDVLGIGALVETLWPDLQSARCSDSVHIARATYQAGRHDLVGAVGKFSRNGRRLLSLPDLAPDVPYCLSENTLSFAARLEADGGIRRLS